MAKFGTIKEIQYYEEREIEWKITDFPSIAKDKIIQSATFSFAGSVWFFALVKQSIKFPGFSGFSLCNVQPWEYTVNYDLGFRKHDGSVDQLSEGILKGNKTDWKIFPFNLPKQLERECEVALNVFTITCTLRRESNDCNQPSIWNKRKLIRTDTLSENFKCLFSNKESCDVTLHVMDKEYQAHKAVLIARSSVFAAMFQHPMSEKQTGVINIQDCDPDSFEAFLEFLYCGKLEDLSFCSALHLYETSNKYNVEELKEFCRGYAIENLTVENVCDAVILADKYDDVQLIVSFQNFFNENYKKVFKTTEWECLMKKNYRLANKLLKEIS